MSEMQTQRDREMNRGREVVRQNSLFDYVGAWAVRPGEADRALDIKRWADAGLLIAEAYIDPANSKKSVKIKVADVVLTETFDEFPSGNLHASVVLLIKSGHLPETKPKGGV